MPERRRLLLALATLGLLLLVAPAAASAATTSWSSLSSPLLAAPAIVSNIDDAPSYRLHTTANVAYQNGYAYTVQSNLNRLTVVDVHNPASPVLVSSVQDSTHMDVPVWIVVQGHYAYVSNKGNGNTDMTGSGLAIYDVADPTNPTYVGSIANDTRLYGAYGLSVVGSVAYVAAQGCVGSTACVTSFPGGNALTTVDVSNPASPRILGSVSSLPRTQHLDSVVVVGNRAYGTAFYTQRITSFDVGDPAHPSILGTRTDPTLTFANDLQVQSHYAYVVDQSTTGARLTVVDITDPKTMPIVGSVLDNTNLNYAYRVRINSRYAFVAAPRANALTVVDLANPASPQVVASVSDPVKIAYPVGFDVAGPDVYLGAYCIRSGSSACATTPHGSFTVIDVSAYADTAPDTSIVAAPPGVSNSTAASFDFASSAAGSTFACSLDGAPATACSGPVGYSGLAAGNHTFTVTATSPGGVSDPTPASYGWTVNTAPPDTSIATGPSGLTASTSATFTVSSVPAGTTFLCQLDGGSWTACGTRVTYTSLAQGRHDFAVAATGAGGTDPTAATRTWTVDTQAPQTTLTSAPSGTVASNSATLGFIADDPAATFQCRLDGGAWTACTSPQTYTALSEGAHTADVRAVDAAGNVDATPASATWTVDTVAPHTTITSAPSGTTTSTSATVSFAADDPAATFECRLDGGAWQACSSPQTYTGLSQGAHTVDVRATDAAGNVEATPASASWTVGSSASVPDTTITSAPSGTTTSTSATVSFTADDPAATFECRLDGAAWQACTSPAALSGLADGSHTFDVRATNAAGTDPTPASATWQVDATPPTVASSTPPATVQAAFSVTFSEAVSGVTTANFTLTAAGASTPVAAAVDCKAADGSTVSCSTGPVSKANLTPTAPAMVGQTYTAAVNPSGATPVTDLAGNAATPFTRTYRAQQTLDEGSPAVTQSWATVADSLALGGSYATADRGGASASYTFSGSSVAWDTITGPGQGTADVYIDGKLKASPSQSATTQTYGVRRSFSGLTGGSHTIKIVPRGDGAVAVDGFDAGGATDASPALATRWQSVSASGASGGTYVQDDVAGASVSLTFRGKRIDWYTTTGPQGGLADVSIDGTSVGTVDTYSAATTYLVKQSFTVPDAVHTITITALGRGQAASTGALVALDRFAVG